jgi:ABC-type antimicrobial peptide transport system permease subunit
MVLAEAAVKDLPEVEQAVTFEPLGKALLRNGTSGFYFDRGIIADPGFFHVLPFRMKAGNPDFLLNNAHDVVLSEEAAQKLFGAENPVGKSLVGEGMPFTVTGIFESLPNNSTLQFDFVASYHLYRELGVSFSWGRFMGTTILQLRKGTDPTAVEGKLTAVARQAGCPQVLDGVRFTLQPYSEIHLDGKHNEWLSIYQSGDSRYIWLMSAVVAMILLIACVNYINLTTARADKRSLEVGLRKVSGAGQGNLSIQFFTESLVFCTISLLIAFFMLWLFWPFFQHITGKELALDFGKPWLIPGIIGVFLVTTLFSGIYPAIILPAFNPVEAIQGVASSRQNRGWLRKGLVVFQFFITSALMIGALVIYRQISYIRKTDTGFREENIICLPMKENLAAKYPYMRQQILQDPAILSVSCSDFLWANDQNRCAGCVRWEGAQKNDEVDFILPQVDFGYFEMLEIPLVTGRYFDPRIATDSTEAFMVNESAVRAMKLDDPVGTSVSLFSSEGLAGRGRIIGVFKDNHYSSLHNQIEPQFVRIYRNPEQGGNRAIMMIKYQHENPERVLGKLEKTWKSINQFAPFEYFFLDQTYENLYQKDRRNFRIITWFTLLAVILSALGIFGLTMFIAGRRTREVAIRKANGATVPHIIWLITWDFTRLVIISFILAIPLAWYILTRVLQLYAYRTTISGWVILLAFLIIFTVAFIASFGQAYKVGRINVASLFRYF